MQILTKGGDIPPYPDMEVVPYSCRILSISQPFVSNNFKRKRPGIDEGCLRGRKTKRPAGYKKRNHDKTSPSMVVLALQSIGLIIQNQSRST